MLPVTADPIRDGAVAFRDGTIVACGPAEDVARAHRDIPQVDLGDAVICPGFVDCHCHLEWSLLGGLLRAGAFTDWLAQMLPIRGRYGDDTHTIAAQLGALRCLEHGTTTVADSGPTGAGVGALHEAGLRGVVALEVVGREVGPDATASAERTAERLAELERASNERVSIGLAPHAPYSVGPGLWEALAADATAAGRWWTSHVAESAAEVRLLDDGSGPMAELFDSAGIEPGRWSAPPGSSPVARLDAHGALDQLDLAAHGVQLATGDAATLADHDVAVAHCPRSNAFLECGAAPLRTLADAGVVVGLGSDSPASGGAYDIRAEARAARAGATADSSSPPSWDQLLEMATHAGARALGLTDVGALEVGAAADLVAIEPPGDSRTDADPARSLFDADAPVVRVAVAGRTLLERSGPVALDACSIVSEADRERAGLR